MAQSEIKACFIPKGNPRPPLELGSGVMITLEQGDIVSNNADAIVNPANEDLQHAGGLAWMIDKATSGKLQQYCDENIRHVPTGQAKEAPGFNLPAKWIINAVGPCVNKDEINTDKMAEHDHNLSHAYTSSLDIAVEKRLKSIAFPTISTGIFGFPARRAAELVRETLREYLRTKNTASLQEIRLVLWEDSTVDLHKTVWAQELSLNK